MLTIGSRVKTGFNMLKKREVEFKSGLKTTSWISNDHVSLAEILSDNKPIQVEDKKQEKEDEDKDSLTTNIVNLFVGESDIFSIVDNITGDIIICDVDRTLLNFIEAEAKYLQYQHEQLITNKIDFKTLQSDYKTWLKQNYKFSASHMNRRKDQLDHYHFLYNEENFKKQMAALKKKKLVTLDINLFNRDEQENLCTALKKQNAKVKLFNLTNLPDYDKNDSLSGLLQAIDWTSDAEIIWNIHDRGPSKEDYKHHYSHYFFVAHNPKEYIYHVSQRPELFGDIDNITLGNKRKHRGIPLSRYSTSDEKEQRKRYIDAFKQPIPSIKAVVDKYKMYSKPRGYVSPRYRDNNIENMKKKFNNIYNNIKKRENVLDTKIIKQVKDIFSSIDSTTAFKDIHDSTIPYVLSAAIFYFQVINSIIRIKETVTYEHDAKFYNREVHPFLMNCMDEIEELKSYDKNINNILIKERKPDLVDENTIILVRDRRNFELYRLEGDKIVSTNFHCQYDRDLITEINDFLISPNKTLKKKDLIDKINLGFYMKRVKDKLVEKVKTDEQFQHRYFDTKKHYVFRVILNAFMLIPIFGGLKYFVTGSYFFEKETQRQLIIKGNMENLDHSVILPSEKPSSLFDI